ncbi:7-cyano-7-deazaguanine synthase QueC [Streptomyces sp. NPDC002138]|uniref:7-cyano-7-deazaguanine synthase QueC n=1 Tax=Streptomyces sp. NPDC002138 TaxID=3154410 RepID=UPI0033303245
MSGHDRSAGPVGRTPGRSGPAERVVVPLSGGLDSAVVAALAAGSGADVVAVSYRYGQRHARELLAAEAIAAWVGAVEHHVVDVALSAWDGSRLTRGAVGDDDADDADDAEDHAPDHDEDAATRYYVPGRNTVFISLAMSLAEARGAVAVHLGFTAADVHYPDTGPEYLRLMRALAALTTSTQARPGGVEIHAPLIGLDKVAIVRQALELGVPVERTWSCYEGGARPCGRCGACRVRDLALIRSGRPELATDEGRAAYAGAAARTSDAVWRFLLRD